MKIYCWSYISRGGRRFWFAEAKNLEKGAIPAGEGNTQMQAVLDLLIRIGGCK